jgi:hypothetical protein
MVVFLFVTCISASADDSDHIAAVLHPELGELCCHAGSLPYEYQIAINAAFGA